MTIAEMVPECKFVCDIGTDHAYLPIYLLENNICQKAVVVEVKEGPLKAAYNNISKKNLQDCVEAILGDGIKALEKSLYLKEGKDDYIIIIAGMGGNLIIKILSEGLDFAKEAKTIILQPMSKLEVVYEWLAKHGFDIIDESLVKDGNKFYNVLAVKWSGIEKPCKPIDLYVGKKLVEKRDPLLGEYINWKISVLNKIIIGLKKSIDCNGQKINEKEDTLNKLISIKNEMVDILKLLSK